LEICTGVGLEKKNMDLRQTTSGIKIMVVG